MKKLIIQIILWAVIAFIAYNVWDTIQTPIDFDKVRKARYSETIAKLMDIRKAQMAYKDAHQIFSGNWDSLTAFIKYDSLPQIRRIGMLTDSMVDAGLDEKAALKKGLIIRDTIKVSVLEEIFGKDYPIDELRYIPKSGKQEFWLAQTIITTGSGVKVPVFEARAHNNQILFEHLEDYKQEIINLNERARKNDRYPGLKVGSVTEPNNNVGNWE
jgi:hypothetical protein